MMNTPPTASRPLRTTAVLAVPTLIITGLATLIASPATAAPVPAAAAPAGLETFAVAAGGTSDRVAPFLTPDGQRVVFTSPGSDLVAGDANGMPDVFLSTALIGSDDPFSGAPILVSAPDGPIGSVRSDGASYDPVASADGRYVAFVSAATNLTEDVTTPHAGSWIFVRDTLLDRTFRVQGTENPNADSFAPDLSDDGRYLVFSSNADNLVSGGGGAVQDANGSTDTYLADLDANSDGVLGDIALTKAFPEANVLTGTREAVISGNGDAIALLSRGTPTGGATGQPLDSLWLTERSFTSSFEVSRDASDPSIDATGTVMAYVSERACDDRPTVVATMMSSGVPYSIGLGTEGTDLRVGRVESPRISPHGSTVAWSTTIPELDPDAVEVPVPLAEPVIRVQEIDWWDATRAAVTCAPGFTPEWFEIGEGVDPTLSVAGRSIAYQAPDRASITVADTHLPRSLSATSVGGGLATPGFMKEVQISKIPVSTLREYAGQIANAPVYRLPVYRLPVYRLPVYRLPVYRLLIDDAPVYRLPVYRLPVYRLPVYRLDLPGGWDQILADTPFSGVLIQSVTLDEVLDWATSILDEGAPATAAENAAALRIRSLTLQDLDIDSTGLAGLSLASFVLGGAPVAQIPIAGAPDPEDAWQNLAVAQGIDLDVDAETLLAELDSAGIAIDSTGVEDVALRDLPIAQTLLGEIPANRLFLAGTPLGAVEVSALSAASRTALFGEVPVAGTLGAPSFPLLAGATAADIAAGAPASVTFGTLLFSLLDAENYPWEEISPSAIDPALAEQSSPGFGCQQNVRCTQSAAFRFAFDVGPGESQVGPGNQNHIVAAPDATIDLPAGTKPGAIYALGSGPGVTWRNTGSYYSGPVIGSGGHLDIPLPDMRAGTVIEISAWFTSSSTVTRFTASAGISSGIYADSVGVGDNAPLWSWDDERNNYVNGQWQLSEPAPLEEGRIYYEWISPRSMIYDEESNVSLPGPAEDSDFFVVRPPAPGERVVVSTNASDGQIALSLYSPSGSESAAALGVANAGAAPGTSVAEQSDFSDSAVAGSDASHAVQGQTLIDQAVVRGGDAAEIQAASTDAAGGENLLVRVTSGNGQASNSLYSLRVRYIRDAVETRCAPIAAPDMGDPGGNDPITDETNTLYIFDSTRYAQTYGWEGADAVDASLGSMEGAGAPGQEVHGAIVSVDNDPEVRAARTEYNNNPCSIAARRELTAAINRYVSARVGEHRDQITSVVIVGGDDILPFAPVPQNTAKFTEQDHATDLRRTTTPTGDPCPADVPSDAVDPCATPLSAAAAASTILTDDPYGLATAYESLGGYLYVPTVGLGRIVETPEQIQASVARFLAADGEMDAGGELSADSSVSGGYGAWSELPDLVTDALEWRSDDNEELTGTWTNADMAERLFPADGSESPRVVSINTHADERRMVPGLPGAEDGAVADADLLHAEERTDAAQLAGALVFLIGCHAGNNLPSAYYGDVDDWVDVFSAAGGFVGNTGFGLANNVTTALGERLLAQYADWVGVEVDGRSVTSAQALTYAKQSYLGGLGLYSGYDEKVLMGAVYYGLPMYTFAPAASGETKSPPLPSIPAGLTAVEDRGDLLSASLRLQPSFDTVPAGGSGGTYLTVDGQQPAVVPGQPVLPRIVSKLDPAPAGLVARGAIITALTSIVEAGVTPAVASAGIGVPEAQQRRSDVAFPSTFATVTTQDTPDGPVDLLVVTPARVEVGSDGTGSTEKFTDLTVEAVYGPAESTDDTDPSITYVGVPSAGGSMMRFRVDGTGSAIAALILLVQREGATQWERVAVVADGDDWIADAPVNGSPFRWMLQVVDAAGNVATDTQRGHLQEAAAPAPLLGDAGDDVTVEIGGHVARTVEVTDAKPDDRLTGSVSVVKDSAIVASGTALIASDGEAMRAEIDQTFTTPGAYTVLLEVCRTTSCTTTSFDVVVAPGNAAPAASVALAPNGAVAIPTSVLTATAEGTDPDGDPVALSYSWTRNGVAVGTDAPTLALTGVASEGDVIAVTVTPNDGETDGHAASASMVVASPPASPTITAAATGGTGGSWARVPVQVSFTCTSGVAVTFCPPTQMVSVDTSPAGIEVTGTMTDALGRSASTSITVKVDRTAPVLAPTATPAAVAVGGTVVLAANATDAASGVESQSCDPPSTASAGTKSVMCRAADLAGNTALATVTYTVQTPAPRMCQGLADRAPLVAINADGSSVFLRTSGVPIVFRACDASGRSIGTKGYVSSVTLVSTASLPAGAKVNEAWYLPLGSFTYVSLAKTWIGQIPTAKLASGKKYTYRVNLADGTSFTFTFGVR